MDAIISDSSYMLICYEYKKKENYYRLFIPKKNNLDYGFCCQSGNLVLSQNIPATKAGSFLNLLSRKILLYHEDGVLSLK